MNKNRLSMRCLLAAALVGSALAGFDASCTYSSEWSNSDKRIEGTLSSLSGCQASSLGFDDTNDMLIGGSGDTEIIGIPAGSGGDGCEGGSDCMSWCQPLCCMAKGCVYATIKKESKTTDYVVYKETVNYYYCRMYSSGSHKDSDSQSTCTKLSSAHCATMAYNAFGVNSTEYNQLVAAAAYPSCDRRRNLLAARRVPTRTQIDAKIRAAFKPFALLKFRASQLMKKGQLKSTIQNSGV